MGFFNSFPDRDTLLKSAKKGDASLPLKVNNHIHTPYSFSAFDSIDSAVKAARSEDVRILGINDFYVCDGYREFLDICQDYGLFPLLNIELIGINKAYQDQGVKVNDPGNPGRTYISGKGLAFPSLLPGKQQEKLEKVVEESNRQVARMIDLVNRWLDYQQVGIQLSVEEIIKDHAEHLLRERHVVKALRVKMQEKAKSEEDMQDLLEKIYGGLSSEKHMDDMAGLEDELRSRLLKAGSPAFVKEDDKAFMSVEEICRIIEDAGGIPTYPMLLDGAGGSITDFESNRENLMEALKEQGFRSVEMIPMRNRLEVLKEYAEYFYDQGFMVSFGTEHNTTAMNPLTVGCAFGTPLDYTLMDISFRGAACLAAHQYLVAREGSAYPGESRDQMEQLGQAVLNYYFSNYYEQLKNSPT